MPLVGHIPHTITHKPVSASPAAPRRMLSFVPRVERTSESHKTQHATQNTSCGFPVPHSLRT
eukprot:2052307-Prymnesium_polylepis.1